MRVYINWLLHLHHGSFNCAAHSQVPVTQARRGRSGYLIQAAHPERAAAVSNMSWPKDVGIGVWPDISCRKTVTACSPKHFGVRFASNKLPYVLC